MSHLYTAADIREWDQFTIKNEPISSIDLMERAAIACCKKILGSYTFSSISVVCGKGNNGGDGLAIARLLHKRGVAVNVLIAAISDRSSADFDTNLKRLPSTLTVTHLTEDSAINLKGDLIIDCLFGSGLDRPIQGWISRITKAMNACKAPIIAIDIPSGLFIENNSTNDLSVAVQADFTLSFQIPKLPFFFAEYAPYIGRFSIVNIDLSPEFKAPAIATTIDRTEISLKKQLQFIHKGNKGFLTLIAGSESMLGAAILASRAAFRTGCGYVGTMSPAAIISPLATTLPEAIWVDEFASSFPKKTSAIAIGPGLGKSDQSLKKLKLAFASTLPIVIDADALNLIAANEELKNNLPKNAILTPHLGELFRLIGKAESPETLLEKQKTFSVKHQVYIIQKGPFSKLTTPEGELFINTTGNSAMASAGMGDALTGMIGSFLAQGYAPLDAAKNGIYYHGLAGDKAVSKMGKHGLITSDLIDHIPAALNAL